jgi:hypothetical protein
MSIIFEGDPKGADPGGGDFHRYGCLIYARCRGESSALAISTGGHKKEERFYSHSSYGTESIYRYNNLVPEVLAIRGFGLTRG